jgi:hypothetical protein
MKKNKPSHPSIYPTAHLLFLFIFFPRAAQPLAPAHKIPRPNSPARPTYSSLSHSLTDGRDPPVKIVFNPEPSPPLSHGRAGRSAPAPSRLPAPPPLPSSALSTQLAPPKTSPPLPIPVTDAHRAARHQWRPPACLPHTASTAPPPLLSRPYISRPELPLQTTPLPGAPPLLYSTATGAPPPEFCPRLDPLRWRPPC